MNRGPGERRPVYGYAALAWTLLALYIGVCCPPSQALQAWGTWLVGALLIGWAVRSGR